jgi:septum site-determining protein MinC
MALAPKGSAPPIFDLKSANLSLVALLLKTADLDELREELERRFADTPQFFGNDPVLIDLAALDGEDVVLDFAALLQLLRENRIHPVAVRGGTPEQHAAALEAGLPEAADEGSAELVRPEPVVRTLVREVEREVIREVVREVPTTVPALIVDRPLRSGQQVYAKGGDLVVLAMVNFGAELIADGSIHVYAPMRGKAIAGARGNTEARIYVTALEPELLAIAGTYRTSENPLPDEVRGKAAQIRLDGDKLLIEPLEL